MCLVYYGITSRWDPKVRFAEHVECQPWADTLTETDPDRAVAAGIFVVDYHLEFSSEAAARAHERIMIGIHRPCYNAEFNEGNPDKVWLDEARAQRAERDAAAGVPLEETWAYLDEQRRRARAAEAGRWLSAAAWRRLAWAVWWATPTAAVWLAAAVYTPVVSMPRLGGVAGALVGWVMLWWVRPGPRRRWGSRRRRRGFWSWRRARNVGGRWALVSAVVWLVWPAVTAAFTPGG